MGDRSVGEPARRILDGTSWEELCDTLKAAGAAQAETRAGADA